MQYSVSLYCLSGSIGLLWIMLSKSGICARGVHITAGCGAVYLLCNYQRSTKVFGTTCTNSFNATPDRNALCLNMEVLRLGFRLCRLRSLVTIQCEPLHGRRQMCPHCRLAVCAANGRSFACLFYRLSGWSVICTCSNTVRLSSDCSTRTGCVWCSILRTIVRERQDNIQDSRRRNVTVLGGSSTYLYNIRQI